MVDLHLVHRGYSLDTVVRNGLAHFKDCRTSREKCRMGDFDCIPSVVTDAEIFEFKLRYSGVSGNRMGTRCT